MASTTTKSTCSASASTCACTCTGTCTSSTDIESSVTSSCTSCYNDEADLRMVVLNNSGFVNNSSSSFKGMVMYYDKRPSHFPPAIDNILWAGLSTRVQEVVDWTLLSSYNSFHRKMEAMVQGLAPHFQKVGYYIMYEKIDAYFRHLAFIRFIPCTNECDGRHGDGNELDGRRRHRQQQQKFRVAVYGGRAREPRCIKGRYYRNRPTTKGVETFVDELTWAVLATEMRPLIDFDSDCKSDEEGKYWTGMCVMVVSTITLIWVALAVMPESPLQIIWACLAFPLGVFLAFCVTLCFSDPPCYSRVLRQMKERIKELSPLVEERTGYTLHFSVESAGVYICFEPRNRSRVSSPEHLDLSAFPEPTLQYHDSSDFPDSSIERTGPIERTDPPGRKFMFYAVV